MSDNCKVPLPNLEMDSPAPPPMGPGGIPADDGDALTRGAADLEAVFDVPVQVSAVLGRTRMEVGELHVSAPARCWNSTARSARRSTFT